MINWINNLLKRIVGYDEMVEEYENKIKALDNINEFTEKYHQDEIKQMQEVIDDLINRKEELKDTIKKLTKDDWVEISEFRAEYIRARGTQSWTLDWDGEGRKPVHEAFRYEDSLNGPQKVKDLATEIKDRYDLVEPSKTEIIEAVKSYFTIRRNWTYILDHENPRHPGVVDYWQELDISANLKSGDCEDLSLLMHVLIRDLFDRFGYSNSKWRLQLTAGQLLGYGGHAFNIYLHDDGEYYAIESTFDLEGSFKRTWLNAPVAYNNLYRSFWGFADPDRSVRNFNWAQNLEALKVNENNKGVRD